MAKIKAKEFQELGYLQEVNRRFLHPLGLALSVMVEEDGSVEYDGVIDWRADPEGGFFGGELDAGRALFVQNEWNKRAPIRRILLGSQDEIEAVDHSWAGTVLGEDRDDWDAVVAEAVRRAGSLEATNASEG